MLSRFNPAAARIGTVGRVVHASSLAGALLLAASGSAAADAAGPERPAAPVGGAIVASEGGWDDMCSPVDVGVEYGTDGDAIDPHRELFAFLGSDDDLAPRPRLAPMREAAQDGKRVGDRRDALPRFGRGPGDRL
jgi:hypothetical protein